MFKIGAEWRRLAIKHESEAKKKSNHFSSHRFFLVSLNRFLDTHTDRQQTPVIIYLHNIFKRITKIEHRARSVCVCIHLAESFTLAKTHILL